MGRRAAHSSRLTISDPHRDSERIKSKSAPLYRNGQPVRGAQSRAERGDVREPRCLNVDHDTALDVVDFDI